MTPKQFKNIRKKMGLTQPQMAEKLGKKERMIRNYELGSHEIPETVKKLLKLIKKGETNHEKRKNMY